MSTRSITTILIFLIIFTVVSLEIIKKAERESQAPVVTVEVTLKNHIFTPSEIYVTEGEKLAVTIHNQDSTAEEFDSSDLNKEKIINPNSSAVINLGPLKAGSYEFTGEFHPKTARGKIIVQK